MQGIRGWAHRLESVCKARLDESFDLVQFFPRSREQLFDHLQFYSQFVSDGVTNVRDVVDKADWNAKAKVVVF